MNELRDMALRFEIGRQVQYRTMAQKETFAVFEKTVYGGSALREPGVCSCETPIQLDTTTLMNRKLQLQQGSTTDTATSNLLHTYILTEYCASQMVQ